MSSPLPEPGHQTSLYPSAQLAKDALNGSSADNPTSGDGQYLEIPLQPPRRRPSLDSTYSDFSELSVHSTELHHGRPLLPPARNNIKRPTFFSLSPPPPRRRRHGIRDYLDAFWLRNKGVLLVLLAMVFGSGMNVSARLMETDGSHGKAMHPFQILFARMSITVLLSLLYGFHTHIPHFPLGHPSVRRLLILRGVGGFFGVLGLYWSLLYLPLAEATVLTFLAPILTCYACSLLIKGESFSRQQQIAGFMSLVGVVFIARPGSLFTSSSPPPSHSAGVANASGTTSPQQPSNTTSPSPTTTHTPTAPTPHQHLHATLLALLGVLGATTAMTTIRKIGPRAHPLISVNYFSSWCTLVSLVTVLAVPGVGFRLPANAQECGLLALLGGFGFVMQFLLTAGLSYGGEGGAVAGKAQRHPRRRTGGAEERRRGDDVATSTIRDIDDVDLEAIPHPSNHHHHPPPTAAATAPKSSGTRATSMLYTQMLFALAFDKWIWGISPEWQSWVGCVVILGSAVWVAAARDLRMGEEEGRGDGERVEEGDEEGDGDGRQGGKGGRRGGRKGEGEEEPQEEEEDEHGAEERHGLIPASERDDLLEGDAVAVADADADAEAMLTVAEVSASKAGPASSP